jgi:hypothetical protein
MTSIVRHCPDCDRQDEGLDRRRFLQATGALALAAGAAPLMGRAVEPAASASGTAETAVKALYESLSAEQRKIVCFDWDYVDPDRGLLRTRISNNWHITEPVINSEFYSDEQQGIIRDVFEGIIHPDWHKRIDQQLEDDAGGYGNAQNLAIFGSPGQGKFQLVMTGRHMTIRCDGDSTEHVAFGGPIFYGHAASSFNEPSDHPGNVFWPQAQEANKVFAMLDGKQREKALVSKLPPESAVGFKGPDGAFPGVRLSELSSDQTEQVKKVMELLLGHYRQVDQKEAAACLDKQGGLEKCSLAFYKDGNIGDDEVWDCWRIEGPSFVWYFRGSPHVHVWVNVADTHEVKLNA